VIRVLDTLDWFFHIFHAPKAKDETSGWVLSPTTRQKIWW